MAKQHPSYDFVDDKARSIGTGIVIHWQQGPVVNERLNGATVEGVLRACVQRLNDLDARVTCLENTHAIIAINEAIGHLEARTKDRHRRGVMGTVLP